MFLIALHCELAACGQRDLSCLKFAQYWWGQIGQKLNWGKYLPVYSDN